jgi:hypothetical protein
VIVHEREAAATVNDNLIAFSQSVLLGAPTHHHEVFAITITITVNIIEMWPVKKIAFPRPIARVAAVRTREVRLFFFVE